jgi:hypothetical protein
MIMMGFTYAAGENFMQFTAKLPLMLLFLFRVVYIIPFSIIVLPLYREQ